MEVIRNVAVNEEEVKKDEVKTEMQQVNAVTKEDNVGKKNETTVEYIKEKDGSYVKSTKEEDDTMVKYIGEKSAAEKSTKVRSTEVGIDR